MSTYKNAVTKICTTCNVNLPLSEFYKHPYNADKLCHNCRECQIKYQRSLREKNKERYIQYNKNRKRKPSSKKEYQKKYPERIKAVNTVNNAIASGRIVRPPLCQGCGDKCKAQGHHEDYLKPLDVIWLCQHCHKYIHSFEEYKKNV